MDRRSSLRLWIPTAAALVLGAAFLFAYRPDLPFDALRAKYASADSRFATVMDVSVHYRSEGSGPTVLLLHGAGSSLHEWDGWVDVLRHDFRTVRLDLPGFGLTGPNRSGDYRIERYVEFLHAFVSELELDAFHLAGHGLGGQLAWNYALEHPGAVNKLVLLNATGYPRAAPQSGSRIAEIPGIGWLASVMTPRSTMVATLEASVADPAVVDDRLVDRYYELSLRPGNRQAAIARLRDAARDQNGNHRGITQPTLIIWGMEDRRVPLADGRGFADDIPGARLITFPGVGHLPAEELPGQSARAALTFLRDRR